MQSQIAIIGGGIAGLAAARRLSKFGFGITVFEKSRGVGGRMATRRINELQFDHGAQYFTAKGSRFREMVNQWQAAGQAGEWFDGAFVGTPSMSAPARFLSEGYSVVTGCQVTALHRDQGGWAVHAADGLVKTPGNGQFSAVINAVPAPQAMPLVTSAGLVFPQLERVRYAPCWALMLAFSSPVALLCDWFRPSDEAIAWVARNGSKPGRDRETEIVVVHATPDWSRRNLELSADAAAKALIARFQALTGIREQPSFSYAHRWRYALVEQAAETSFLWDESKRLGACGDWCLGPRVEAAFDSGEALADGILQTQEADLVV